MNEPAQQKEKISWRNVNPTDFLASWDLDGGQEIALTIKDFEVGSPPSNKKKKGLILLFEGTEKKLFMNATNAKVLNRATRSNKPANWIGQRIVLFVQDGVRNPTGGEDVQGLRIRIAPKS